MTEKVWFITGTTTGLGREWAIAALDRGDRVAATARNIDRIADLVDTYGDRVLPIALDVTDRLAVFDAVARAHQRFGRLDVVVNNAGYGQYGMVEELSEQDMRDLIDTNLFGAVWVTQAVLPFLREQGSGHILQVASVGGLMAGPTLGIYHASKWALEGISESLAQEVRGFGIKVTIVEPTGYATAAEGSARRDAESGIRAAARAVRRQSRRPDGSRRRPGGHARRDPCRRRRRGAAVADHLRRRAAADVDAIYGSRLATWREWEAVSVAAHGTPPA